MEHEFLKHDNCPDPGHCDICDGGLAVCTICGGADGQLPTECPGARMSEQQKEDVYAGRLNFVGGRWISRDAVGSPYEGIFEEWESFERQVQRLRTIIQNPVPIDQGDLDSWKECVEVVDAEFDSLVEKTYRVVVENNRGIQ